MKALQNAKDTRTLNTHRYREWYQKEKRHKLYHPFLHLGFNLGVLASLIFGHFYFVEKWSAMSLLGLVSIFILGNIVVWAVHKFPLHQRFKFWSFPYEAHTVEHHRYFTSHDITYDNHRDYLAIFFPSSVIASFALIAQPAIYFLTQKFLNTDMAHILAGGAAAYFLSYELFHWASHLPQDHAVMRFGWIRYMREHHRIHHCTRLMNRYNFCIVYPMMDILMGTKYKGPLPDENVEDHYADVAKNFKETTI